MKRYTLTECYELLSVDPKTFRGWLEKAGIEAQVSKADPRVKYLNEEQLRYLAKEHERSLERVRQGPEVIPPNAYKTLKDQVDSFERQASTLEQRQAGMYEELQGNIAEVEARQKQVYEELLATVASRVDEVRQAVEREHRQYESLVELLNQQAVLVDQVRADLAGNREDVRVVREQVEAVQARQAEAMVKLHQTFRQELQQTMHELREQVEVLLEQRVREVYNGLNKEVAADLAAITERIDQLATHIEAVKITALGYQQRADAQDQAIADLRVQLQEEAQAREVLATQIATLPEVEKAPGKQPRR